MRPPAAGRLEKSRVGGQPKMAVPRKSIVSGGDVGGGGYGLGAGWLWEQARLVVLVL